MFLPSILGCIMLDPDKVLVSRMTLAADRPMPDKAMRNHQNLAEYYFNIFMGYKVYRIWRIWKNTGFCHIQRYSELNKKTFKILKAKEIQIQTSNVLGLWGTQELLLFCLEAPLRAQWAHQNSTGFQKKKFEDERGEREKELQKMLINIKL